MSLSPEATPRTPDAYEQFWVVEESTAAAAPAAPPADLTPPDAYGQFLAAIEG